MALRAPGQPTVPIPGTTNQRTDASGRQSRGPGQRRAEPGGGARSGAAASATAAGGTRPGAQAVPPPATVGLCENRSATPRRGFGLRALTLSLMSANTGLGPNDTNPTTLQSDARNSTAEARGQARGAPRPPTPGLSHVPARRPATPRAAGRRREGQAVSRRGSSALRSQTKARRAPGRDGKRRPRPAGGAVLRGPGRLPLRTEQSCSRAMFPAARRFARGPGGGEAAAAARSSRPGAAAVPLGAHRGHQPASLQAGLRGCGPPSPRLPAAAALREPPDGRRLRPRGAPAHRPAPSRAAQKRGTARARAAPPAAAARAPLKWRAPGAPAHLSGERERRVPAAPPARMCPPRPARAPLAPSRPIARRGGPRPRAPGGGAGGGARGSGGLCLAPRGREPRLPEAGARREPGASLSASGRPRERVRALVASAGGRGRAPPPTPARSPRRGEAGTDSSAS